MLTSVQKLSSQILLIDEDNISNSKSNPDFELDFMFTNTNLEICDGIENDPIYMLQFIVIDFMQDSNVYIYDYSVEASTIKEDSFIKFMDIKINLNWLCESLLKNNKVNNALETGIVSKLNDIVKKEYSIK